MRPVPAPEGYEGCRFFDEGTKEWSAVARPVGSTWWTSVGLCGHQFLKDAELDAQAQKKIENAVTLGMVK